MTGRWRAALGAAVALACAAAGAAEGAECDLARADRARTTSQHCMACHDGSVGPGVGYVSSGGTGSASRTPVNSHPVGISYAAAAARQPGEYAPASSLPADVPLPNGMVECTTCHDGKAANPNRVVPRTGLCTACHIR